MVAPVISATLNIGGRGAALGALRGATTQIASVSAAEMNRAAASTRVNVSSDFQQLFEGLDRVQRRYVPRAAAEALNRSRNRAKTLIARDVASKWDMRARSAKRSVILPKPLAAKPWKLRSTGFVQVIVPEFKFPGGQQVEFTSEGVKDVPASRSKFLATVRGGKGGKRRGKHTGFFYRVDRSHPRWRREKRPDGQWTELPIKESMVNATPPSEIYINGAVATVGREWPARAEGVLQFHLDRAGLS